MSITQRFIEQSMWDRYIHHPFVQQLAAGTLPKACFQHYLKQDYLYLFQYSRALSLGIYKAENFAQINQALSTLNMVLGEIDLHIQYCKEWGVSEQDLSQHQESHACIAYTRYVLDCGMHGALPELYAALAPCPIGYAEIGRYIQAHQLSVSNNPYQSWIDTYASEDYQQVVAEMQSSFEQLWQSLPEEHLNKLSHIFATATRMEAAFWQMGLDLA